MKENKWLVIYEKVDYSMKVLFNVTLIRPMDLSYVSSGVLFYSSFMVVVD